MKRQGRLIGVPRVMLILPTETYRATPFLHAAELLGLQVVVASNEAPTLARLMDCLLYTSRCV